MSVHAPSLPSSVSWETPLSVSRDVIEAIGDVADQAADAAGQLLHRRRSRAWPSKLAAVAIAVTLVLVVAAAMRRSRDDDPGASTQSGMPD